MSTTNSNVIWSEFQQILQHINTQHIKLFYVATFGDTNTLQSRQAASADIPDEAFYHQPPYAVDRSLELICVAVA